MKKKMNNQDEVRLSEIKLPTHKNSNKKYFITSTYRTIKKSSLISDC